MRVFIDTGVWFGYLVRNDQHHNAASRVLVALQAEGLLLVTSELIISETYTLLMRKLGTKIALKFLDIINAQAKEAFTEIVWTDRAILTQAHRILEKFSDQPITLADATSAAILMLKGVANIATFNRHFRLLGFATIP